MPLPTTQDVAKVIRFLKKEKPGMPRKQKVAIALRQTGRSKFGKRKKKSGAMMGTIVHHSQWF